MDWHIAFAIAATVVSSQVIGFLWYGPIFGNTWIKGMGWGNKTDAELKQMMDGATPGYIASALLNAGAVALLWVVLVEWNVLSLMDTLSAPVAGMLAASVGFLMFYVPGTFVGKFFSETTWSVWAISAGYWFILAVLEGLFVGLFSGL